jgi:hypothetical protein
MILELKAEPIVLEPQEHGISHPPLAPFPIERRREPRYPVNDPVEICLLEAPNSPWFAGTMLDVSRSGLRVEVPTPIGKSMRVEIVLPNRAIIFAETRYCRPASDFFHVGAAIEDVYYPRTLAGQHTPDDQLSLYLVGKGLTGVETTNINNHLMACKVCRSRLAKADGTLNPKGAVSYKFSSRPLGR